MQCHCPHTPRYLWGAAGSGSGGSISPGCLCVCWCRKCRLLEAPARLAPAWGSAGGTTSQPWLCTLLPKVCWRAQLCPGTGGCSQTPSEDSPWHQPAPQPSLPFTPRRSSACSLTSSALFAFGSSCGKTRLNANTIPAHTPKKKRSCG